MNTFGDRFKSLRLTLGYTQDELINKFNKEYNYTLTKSAISQYENNKRFPEINALKYFSSFFKVSIDYLLCANEDIIQETSSIYISTKESTKNVELQELINSVKENINFNPKIKLNGNTLTDSSKQLIKNCLDVTIELAKKNQ
ncbi:helix-turn-helix domain-containing protein [Clostridium felsineum]|uniref:helix-turn-helix domain-containing protein n=1 Tax=Clostridium felsineum TaxID=36839 RepID=UPI00098C2943|nr:helix-turn-helix domain-containing protein [Clostridium felsineum]URZ03848.1 hypothetical protein CLAUR_039140 [Clostridium felsineum]